MEMKTPVLAFGDWLKSEMDRRGLSITELAEKMDVRTGTVSRWVNNQRIPEPSMTIRIADAMALDPDVVLDMAGHRALRKPATTSDIMSELQSIEKMYAERVDRLRDELRQIAGVSVSLAAAIPSTTDAFRKHCGTGRVRFLEDDLRGATRPFATVANDPVPAIGILPGDIVAWNELSPGERPARGDIVLAAIGPDVTIARWNRDAEMEVLGVFITYKPNPEIRMHP